MTTFETLEPRTRPLTSAERRLLGARARELRSRSANAPKVLMLGAAVAAVLCVLTLLASDAPWPVVVLFWVVVGGGISLWVWRDARADCRQMRAMARRLESSLEHDLAEVYEIRARGFAELEEIEDEGACYLFDLGEERLVLISGQELYPAARFPSLDFSLIYPLDGKGAPVDFMVEKHGARASPDRVIPARVKRALEIPEHLSVLHGSLDRVETILPKQGD